MKKKGCKWIKKELGKYLDSEIDSKIRKIIDDHLSQCESCRTELAGMKKVNLLGKSLHYSEPPEEYWKSIIPRINKQIITKNSETIPEKFIIFFREIFTQNNIARNVIGATAAAVIIFFILKINNYLPAPLPSKQNEVAKLRVAENIEPSQKESVEQETKIKSPSKKPEEKLLKPKKPSATAFSDNKTPQKAKIIKKSTETKKTEIEKTPEQMELAITAKTLSEQKVELEKEEVETTPEKEKLEQIAPTTENKEKTKKFAFTEKTVKPEIPVEEKRDRATDTEIALFENRRERIILPGVEDKRSINNLRKDNLNGFNKIFKGPAIDKNSYLKQEFAETKKQQSSVRTERKITEIDKAGKEQLLKQKDEIIQLLKNNDDSIKEIIYLKELDDIYYKLLSIEHSREIFEEANDFYARNENKLIKILGRSGYRERITMLRRIKR